ncbi:aldose 1-epimerase family protein [Beijerinckia indica]|uniref:aldose 1-epimerase family protein n=1 Tax=Beijerinckia indica TaxID=533 RepID=UPI00130508D5|nr:aldose 1-epimerase family protein [Beijerinckia indica]
MTGRSFIIGTMGALLWSLSAFADETILTSAKKNIHLDEWSATSPAGSAQTWSVKKVTLHGGKQEGVDLITVDNGKLSFSIVPTRGMSALRAQMGDIRLGWDSPVKEIVNPVYINLLARDGVGWLDGFNEWMPRAGIAWAGHPGKDGANTLTLHGQIGNIPASEVSVSIEKGNPGRIVVKGLVNEISMFGSNLTLNSEVSTEIGSNHIVFNDSIVNNGTKPQEYQIIYHSDYGEPILEGGAKFVAPIKELRPFDGVAAKAISTFDSYLDAKPGFTEEVFGIVPYGDANNRTSVLLHNAAGDKGVSLTYAIDGLPYFALWKNTGAKGEAYVTGLEPATSFPANRSIERKAGRVPTLEPGASQSFTVDFAILSGKDAVNAAVDKVKAIQAGRPTNVNTETIKPCCLSVVN